MYHPIKLIKHMYVHYVITMITTDSDNIKVATYSVPVIYNHCSKSCELGQGIALLEQQRLSHRLQCSSKCATLWGLLSAQSPAEILAYKLSF